MGEQFEQAISLRELCLATKQCKKGVLWKDSVANHYLRALTKNQKLADEVKSGRYRLSPYTTFQIYEPKRREICATKMRDRVLQRSFCNNGVRHDLTRSFIYDNGACIRNKGKDFTVYRAICMLERYFRRYGDNAGWAVHLDVKSYFPSTPHTLIRQALSERIQDKDFLPYLFEIVESYRDKRSGEEIEADEYGERGIGLGSELSQLVQLAILDRIDHTIKELLRPDVYIRYMDDFLIVCREKCDAETACAFVQDELGKLGLKGVNKEGIYPVKRGVVFLKLRFLLTETGRVIVKVSDRTFRRERRQLRNLSRLVSEGRRTMDDVQRHYQSWVSMIKPYDSGAAIKRMDQFYTGLFGARPDYKYKRRKHRHVQKRKRAAPHRAAEERGPCG